MGEKTAEDLPIFCPKCCGQTNPFLLVLGKAHSLPIIGENSGTDRKKPESDAKPFTSREKGRETSGSSGRTAISDSALSNHVVLQCLLEVLVKLVHNLSHLCNILQGFEI